MDFITNVTLLSLSFLSFASLAFEKEDDDEPIDDEFAEEFVEPIKYDSCTPRPNLRFLKLADMHEELMSWLICNESKDDANEYLPWIDGFDFLYLIWKYHPGTLSGQRYATIYEFAVQNHYTTYLHTYRNLMPFEFNDIEINDEVAHEIMTDLKSISRLLAQYPETTADQRKIAIQAMQDYNVDDFLKVYKKFKGNEHKIIKYFAKKNVSQDVVNLMISAYRKIFLPNQI